MQTHPPATEELATLSPVLLSKLEVGELFHLSGQSSCPDDSENYVPEWRVARRGRLFYDVKLNVRAGGHASVLRSVRLAAATKVCPLSRTVAEREISRRVLNSSRHE